MTKSIRVMKNFLPLIPLSLLGLQIPLAALSAETPVKPMDEVTLSQAHKGTLEIDTRLLDSYGRLPEPRRAFYLKAREILAAQPDARLTDSKVIEAARQAGLSLVSGPMLGDVSHESVRVWFRPVHAGSVQIEVKPTTGGQPRLHVAENLQPGEAVMMTLDALEADTPYEYRLLATDGKELGGGSFHTPPRPGAGTPLRIAFGSCFHKIGLHNPNLMQLIVERGNRAMMLLGDLAVDDREAKLNLHAADYLLRDMSLPWRTFSSRMPLYASWDDHDYLNNDLSGLQKGRISEDQRNALRNVWAENWIQPGPGVKDRGIYFSSVLGDVEIIMLDTRSCREWDRKGQRGSYLGNEQMEWLKQTLKASKAKFILLSSGTMWSDFMSKAKDSWGVWDIPGREEIYDFIEANRIGGVLLLSGDRHGARGFRIERPSGFTLVEMEAATLGGVPGPGPFAPDRSNQLFGYGGGLIAFGEFSFALNQPDPEVTFRLINEAGHAMETHSFKRSQLTPGR